MRWIIAAALSVFVAAPVAAHPQSSPPPHEVSARPAPDEARAPLPSREIARQPFVLDVADLEDWALADFDAIDAATEAARQAKWVKNVENPAKSLWAIKQHWDIGWIGVNGGMLHGTILGTHLTVAEWGRWNFGTPGAGIGFLRHATYNQYTKQTLTREDFTFIANISISYRLGYIKAFGYNAYLNFANTYDLRFNFPSSQIGLSFSRK
jgi:hypothetical protein